MAEQDVTPETGTTNDSLGEIVMLLCYSVLPERAAVCMVPR